ncbi:hypothetical protein N473_02820 [Pseudoalteromonas luteoviolacea CPMOR-1]|uniref:DUF7878 domain-containing protein n=1 Tax=Pseudoalteromonas luteoviolacea CPMOR-1 TaxID=1365248 RepID=A0A161Y0F6_9GAMM|nr:hypothetical protein [Pseudoalteromonas luteoviolacea]KZN59866.1 hypothetical protein N473_02820 [Pseudoalteromonas luteoviolacea CPMOR-1]
MNSMPCEINFQIVDRPEEPLTKMALSQVDGRLQILNEGRLIFSEDDICLAEFAAQLSNWLNKDFPCKPFIHESMDYEEPFVIMADVVDNDITLSSPWWVEGISSPSIFKLNEFIDAVNLFLNKFEEELPNISSIY